MSLSSSWSSILCWFACDSYCEQRKIIIIIMNDERQRKKVKMKKRRRRSRLRRLVRSFVVAELCVRGRLVALGNRFFLLSDCMNSSVRSSSLSIDLNLIRVFCAFERCANSKRHSLLLFSFWLRRIQVAQCTQHLVRARVQTYTKGATWIWITQRKREMGRERGFFIID